MINLHADWARAEKHAIEKSNQLSEDHRDCKSSSDDQPHINILRKHPKENDSNSNNSLSLKPSLREAELEARGRSAVYSTSLKPPAELELTSAKNDGDSVLILHEE